MRNINYFFVFILFILTQNLTYAQDRHWVATSTASWNSNNWSSIAGGVPDGIGAPTASQNAIFNGLNPANCSVNIPVTIESIQINSGYTGTIDINTNSFI